MKFTTFLQEAEDQVNQPEQPQQLDLPLQPQPPTPTQTTKPVAPPTVKPKLKGSANRFMRGPRAAELIKLAQSDQEDTGVADRLRRAATIIGDRLGDEGDENMIGDRLQSMLFSQDDQGFQWNHLNDSALDLIESNQSFNFNDGKMEVIKSFLDTYDYDMDDRRDLVKGLFSKIDFSNVRGEEDATAFPFAEFFKTHNALHDSLGLDKNDLINGEGLGEGLNKLLKVASLQDSNLQFTSDTLRDYLDNYRVTSSSVERDEHTDLAMAFRHLLLGNPDALDDPGTQTIEGFLHDILSQDNYEDADDKISELTEMLNSDLGNHAYFNNWNEDLNSDNLGHKLIQSVLSGINNGPGNDSIYSSTLTDLAEAMAKDLHLDNRYFKDVLDVYGDDRLHQYKDRIKELLLDDFDNYYGENNPDDAFNATGDRITDNDDLKSLVDYIDDNGEYINEYDIDSALRENDTFRNIEYDLEAARDRNYQQETGKGSGDYENLGMSGTHVDYDFDSYDGWNYHDVADYMTEADLRKAGIDSDDVRSTNRSVYIQWMEDIDEDAVLDFYRRRYPDKQIYERGSTNLTSEARKDLEATGRRLAAFDAVKTFKRWLEENGQPGMILYNTPIQRSEDVGGMRELLYAKNGFGKAEDGQQYAVIGSDGKAHPINPFSKEEMKRLQKEKQELRGERREEQKNKEGNNESIANRIRRLARERDDAVRTAKPELNRRLDDTITRSRGLNALRANIQQQLEPQSNQPNQQNNPTNRGQAYARALLSQGFTRTPGYDMTRQEREDFARSAGLSSPHFLLYKLSDGNIDLFYTLDGKVIDKNGNNVIPKNFVDNTPEQLGRAANFYPNTKG